MPTTQPETTFVAEPGSHSLTSTAIQAAPREAVYRAYTDPELLVRFWGPPELSTEVDEFDLRPGGRWRFVHRDEEGNEEAFRGVIHSLVPNEQIIQTFEWEGLPGHVSLQTLTLEDAEGGTKVTQHAVFQSVEDRDGMAETGARDFAPVGMAQLAEVLADLP
jgi:uncharacterized protein YndB with AHSA1/START domain